MFNKHLPPSAGLPRVLALDESAAADLPADIILVRLPRPTFDGAPPVAQDLDAIVGYAAPDHLDALFRLLRPGGRLVLAHRAEPDRLLGALTSAGFIHCLAESVGDLILYRGERPPAGSSLERVQALSATSHTSAHPHLIFLLITQTPNKPAWKLAPGEELEWRAATVLDPATGKPVLLAFSSLIKAVAFMQAAILAKFISGVNKVGKFRADVAGAWTLPLALNPLFDDVRSAWPGPDFRVDPRMAITGDE